MTCAAIPFFCAKCGNRVATSTPVFRTSSVDNRSRQTVRPDDQLRRQYAATIRDRHFCNFFSGEFSTSKTQHFVKKLRAGQVVAIGGSTWGYVVYGMECLARGAEFSFFTSPGLTGLESSL